MAVPGGRDAPAITRRARIDRYEFIVHSRLGGHGSKLCDGLSNYVDLKPAGRQEFGSGAVAMR